MKSKTTSTAKPVKTSNTIKAEKTNGVVSKTEKTNGATKPAKANGAIKLSKANGTVKNTRKQLSAASPVTGLTQDDTAKRHTIEQLKQRAYFNYLKEGCPNDRAMDHWLDAEAQMAGE